MFMKKLFLALLVFSEVNAFLTNIGCRPFLEKALMKVHTSTELHANKGANATVGLDTTINGADGKEGENDQEKSIRMKAIEYFPMGEFLTFVLEEHKPLGCTAEECVVEEEDGSKHAFVSNIVKGGNAEKAGILVGDVIVGVTGIFDNVVDDLVGAGLDRVRLLVAGRPPATSLKMIVVRGTDIVSKHESGLLDLCLIADGNDKNLEQCLTTLYENDYNLGSEGADEVDCDDKDTECMLDSLFGVWNEEYEDDSEKEDINKNEKVSKRKVAPWSSRSSPSGTYVRDPKTGKMVNIDE